MKIIYRTITPDRLTDDVLRERSDQARVLYMHLNCGKVTCQVPGLVRAGIFALAEDTGYPPEVVTRALDELVAHGLAEYDATARLIRLPRIAGDHARLGSARNNVVGWINALRQMPASALRTRHARELRDVCSPQLQESLWDVPGTRELWETDQPVPAPSADRSDSVRTSEQEQEQEQRHTPHAREPAQEPPTIGAQLRRTREAWGHPVNFAAGKLGVPRSRVEDLEADRVVPTRVELERFAAVYGHPPLAQLPLPERDPEVARKVVAEYHRRAVEVGRAQPGPTPEPTAADIKHIWSTGEGEQTLARWMTVLARWREVIRRRGDKARDQFTLSFLAHPEVRQDVLSNADLDKPRETSRAPPSRRSASSRISTPPVNDSLTYDFDDEADS